MGIKNNNTMKFASLAIAALIGAMSIEDVAAIQKRHHHHQPHHHSKMQTFEEPEAAAPAKPIDAEPQFQEDKDKLKKMKQEKKEKPEITEDEAAAKFKGEVDNLANEAAAKKSAKDVKKLDKATTEVKVASVKVQEATVAKEQEAAKEKEDSKDFEELKAKVEKHKEEVTKTEEEALKVIAKTEKAKDVHIADAKTTSAVKEKLAKDAEEDEKKEEVIEAKKEAVAAATKPNPVIRVAEEAAVNHDAKAKVEAEEDNTATVKAVAVKEAAKTVNKKAKPSAPLDAESWTASMPEHI